MIRHIKRAYESVRLIVGLAFALCFFFSGCRQNKIHPEPGFANNDQREIVLDVMHKHFTVDHTIASPYLTVYSHRTAECHTAKFWDEPDVIKTTVLSPQEFSNLKNILSENNLKSVKAFYPLRHFVIDSWTSWDIQVLHPSAVQKISVAGFSPESAIESEQPYPDGLVNLGCTIIKIRREVYRDGRTYSEGDCKK